MEKDLVWITICGAIMFLSLWLYMGYKIGVDKYETYYNYYIGQYPAMETIDIPQDLSIPN